MLHNVNINISGDDDDDETFDISTNYKQVMEKISQNTRPIDQTQARGAYDDCMRVTLGVRRIPVGDAVAPAKAQQGVLWVGARAEDGPVFGLKVVGTCCGDLCPGGLCVLDVLSDNTVGLELPELVPGERL